MLAYLKTRRRRRILEQPLPDGWREYVRRNAPVVEALGLMEDPRFVDALKIIRAEKPFEGCNGQEITEEVRISIAALAAVLLVGNPGDYYPRVERILVYPSTFRNPRAEGREHRLGEASRFGFLVLSWRAVQMDARRFGEGHCTVIHEFAHMLDAEDFRFDGTPPLADEREYRVWSRVFGREFERLEAADREGEDTLLDPYGATDPAEFFAVATETFFEMPLELVEESPELYELLRRYFKQDPAGRGPLAGFEEEPTPADEPVTLVEGRRVLRLLLYLLTVACLIGAADVLEMSPVGRVLLLALTIVPAVYLLVRIAIRR
jgi:MtfA peptidase